MSRSPPRTQETTTTASRDATETHMRKVLGVSGVRAQLLLCYSHSAALWSLTVIAVEASVSKGTSARDKTDTMIVRLAPYGS